MPTQPTPVEVARAFTEAWTRHDMDAAAGFLAADVVYDGPANHVTGADAYIAALDSFARVVTGLEILAALGDDEQAMIIYEVTTGTIGRLRCVERITVHDGKIQTDLLTFDTFASRTSRGAGARE